MIELGGAVSSLPDAKIQAFLKGFFYINPNGAPRGEKMPETKTLYTIGHSNRKLEDFLALLQAHGVKQIVDVRSIPRSARNPQFKRENLAPALAAAGIGYRHFPGLGGFRKPSKDSPNQGWRNAGFRGYADYMLGSEFKAHLNRLLESLGAEKTALMCAEAMPWKCHRSLISDALTARGFEVRHIMSPRSEIVHQLTQGAEPQGDNLFYRQVLPKTEKESDQLKLEF